jgi:hypothetical protein
MKISKNLKRLYGNLNSANLRKGLEYSKKIISGVHRLNKYANDAHLDSVKGITDKIIHNKEFKTFEKGVAVGDGLTKIYDTHKNGGLFNPVSEQQKGIRYNQIKQQFPHKSMSKISSPIKGTTF